MFGKKDKRFKVIYEQGSLGVSKILQDKETGVNYLFVSEGYAGGLTPLLDRDGKPIITRVEDEEK